MRQRLQNNILNACIFLNSLLLFIALFGTNIKVAVLAQVMGRMHPLLLHFPIVLILLTFISELFVYKKEKQAFKELADWLLLSAAFTSVVVAMSGLVLSKETEYNQEAISLHKWAGIAISVLSLFWYLVREKIRSGRFARFSIISLSAITIILTGHFGAGITHGENFLFDPLSSAIIKDQKVVLEEAIVYKDFIRPILEVKCMGCHNSNKAKGNLIMETESLLLKGGKNGKLWDSTLADFGLMMQRIHMSEEAKEHMPPAGKPQLTDDEKKAIFYWLKSGASFTQKIVDYPETDSLSILAASKFKRTDADNDNFPPVDAAIIKELNTNYRLVQAINFYSPALQVAFYGAGFYKSEHLKELDKIKNNIIDLSMNKMPVTDEDLQKISSFTNLRKLNVSFTKVTGTGLIHLKQLKQLRQLSLSGNTLKADDLDVLKDLRELTTVYIWNTGISEKDMHSLKNKFPKVVFQTGFTGDTITAQLNAPVIEGGDVFFTDPSHVKIKGLIKNVVVRYTTDGSIPDSLTSPVYKNDIVINRTATLKVKSFLPGWISSKVAEKSFYHTGIKIDSIELEAKPNPQYAANGGKTLHDKIKGDLNFRTKWLGYRENDMKVYLYFNKPVKLSGISMSMLVDVNSYIMPAEKIEIWGGNNKASLRLLKTIKPLQPNKGTSPTMSMNQVNFTGTDVTMLKAVVKPVILPGWHPGKGQKAWVFFDEFFVQ